MERAEELRLWLTERDENFRLGHAVAKFGERFPFELLRLKHAQQFVDEKVHVFGENFSFEQFVEAAVCAKPATDEAIIGIDHLAAWEFRARAAKADIGDLVLAAARRAAAEMD